MLSLTTEYRQATIDFHNQIYIYLNRVKIFIPYLRFHIQEDFCILGKKNMIVQTCNPTDPKLFLYSRRNENMIEQENKKHSQNEDRSRHASDVLMLTLRQHRQHLGRFCKAKKKKISCVQGSPTDPKFLCRSYNFFFNLTKKFYKKGNFCATCCKKQIENPAITARVIVV